MKETIIACKKKLDNFNLPIEFKLEVRPKSLFLVCTRLDSCSNVLPHNMSSKVFFNVRPSAIPKNVLNLSLKRMYDQISLSRDFPKVVDFVSSNVNPDEFALLPPIQKKLMDSKLVRRELSSMITPVVVDLVGASFDLIFNLSEATEENPENFKLTSNGWEKSI